MIQTTLCRLVVMFLSLSILSVQTTIYIYVSVARNVAGLILLRTNTQIRKMLRHLLCVTLQSSLIY